MKASYMLPSGTYNLLLSKDELQQLIDTGRLVTVTRHTKCTTGRAVWRPEENKMETLDKKEISNNLHFYLDEPVADIKGGDCHIQFLNIHVEY